MKNRLWHQSYPNDMPFDAAMEADLTLDVLLARSFAKYPGHPAFACEGVEMTYRQLDNDSKAFAAFLQDSGFRQGDRLALMLPNALAYPVAMIGALRAGLTIVSINPLYTAREATHQLTDSGAVVIVASEALVPLLREVDTPVLLKHVICENTISPELSAHSKGSATFSQALRHGRDCLFSPPSITPDDLAFLQYTGGTTGIAKGARLTHANMVASVTQMLTWLDEVYVPGECACITPLPLYHIYPMNVALLVMSRGGVNRLIPNPRNLDALLAEFKRGPFTLLLGVNTLFNSLLANGKLDRADFVKTSAVIGAGATIQLSVAREWIAATGVPIREGYGLTECSPCVTFNVLHGREWTGSIGLPVPSTDVKLIDQSGETVPIGQSGELCVKGPQVFSGYWNRPQETVDAFTADGWFRTGDIARFDATGHLFLVDRLKDMILVSGFNVYPNEIEGVVALMPGVLECACIGAPSERTGEEPHLFVVVKDAQLQAADIEAHCRSNLAAYKIPRRITFVDALPKSAVGKILRKSLRSLPAN